MAYPDDVLSVDKHLVLHRRPHWKTFIGAVLLGVLLTLVASVLWWWISNGSLTGVWLWLANGAVAVLWIIAMSVWFLSPLIRWATTHFVITDRRVMFRTGVFTRSGIDIPLLRINTVQFTHGFIDRLLGTGTLIIESASDDPLRFQHIPQVESVHSKLYELLHRALEEEDGER